MSILEFPDELINEIIEKIYLKTLLIFRQINKFYSIKYTDIDLQDKILNYSKIVSSNGKIRHMGEYIRSPKHYCKFLKHGYGVETNLIGVHTKETIVGYWTKGKFVKGNITRDCKPHICSYKQDNEKVNTNVILGKQSFIKIMYHNSEKQSNDKLKKRYKDSIYYTPKIYLGNYTNSANGYGMTVGHNEYWSPYYKIDYRVLEKKKKWENKYIGQFKNDLRNGFGCSNDYTESCSQNYLSTGYYREGLWDKGKFTGLGIEYILIPQIVIDNLEEHLYFTQKIKLCYYDKNQNKQECDFKLIFKSYNGTGNLDCTNTYEKYLTDYDDQFCKLCSNGMNNLNSFQSILKKTSFKPSVLNSQSNKFLECGCEFCKFITKNNLVINLNNIVDYEK